MTNFKNIAIATVAAVMISACGGGGGSGGESHSAYQITLTAERTQLPINIAGVVPGLNGYSGTGVNAVYTTTLYVQANDGGQPIPGGKDIFGCNTAYGLSSGPLYYLDGDTDHEVDYDLGGGTTIKIPGAYRSITLPSNAGGASFHFHASNQAGIATITCSVHDPRLNKDVAASVNITVGSAAGNPARTDYLVQKPGYLGVQGNLNKLPTAVGIQVMLWDDSNQHVPDPVSPNVQVRIKPVGNAAEAGATLLAGGGSGTGVVQVRSNNGVALFSLASGATSGPIVLEVTTDRFDNDVTNGIQQPVVSLFQVYAVQDVASTPLAIASTDLGTATTASAYTYSLEATGGMPPYTWSVTGLPAGLTADSSGVISGNTTAAPGSYHPFVKVTDANGLSLDTSATIVVAQGIKPEDFVISGCPATQDINVPCAIGHAAVNANFAYAFTASVPGVTWSFSGLPSWLTASSGGSTGVISGTPVAVDIGTHLFFVTATLGSTSVTRGVSITVP